MERFHSVDPNSYLMPTLDLTQDIISSVSELSPIPIYQQLYGNSTVKPILTVNNQYSTPLVSFYETIDNSERIHKMMTNYYYFKVLDDWLMNELSDILNYFVIDENGSVKIIENPNANLINFDDVRSAERKVDYIQDNIFTKYNMYDILKSFTKNERIKFVSLPTRELELRQAVREYFRKRIRDIILKAKQSRLSGF